MNVKIEQELNFVVDDSRLFLDAQEAKKVSERTVDRYESTRGGHIYTCCTDTRDRDQNLIGPNFGLDPLISPVSGA